MAVIHVKTGPMASEKTSSMLRDIHKFSNVAKERVLLINFSKDSRGSCESGVSTHMYGDSKFRIPIGKYIDPIRVSKLHDISKDTLGKYDHIAIDEAQFYPDLNSFIRSFQRDPSKTFYIAGLSFDSNNKPFGQVADLLDIATTFVKQTAICPVCDPKLMIPAAFTHVNHQKSDVVEIGGLDVYVPMCHRHYLEHNP